MNAPESTGAPRTRLCGRCRKPSERDPADTREAADWFLCPPCRESLLAGTGRQRRS